MREILFKAKRKDNGEWIEGYYYKRIQGSKVVDAIEKYNGNIESIEYYEIDPETICQFTGLLDKNGNKIWEHDICSTDLKRPYSIVVFRNGCFMYELNDGDKDYFDIMMPIEPLVDSDKYTEVIGNVFDFKERANDRQREAR